MANLPAWLNPFDFLIGFALIAGVALGFVRGLIRMAMNLLALYIATVVAMSFYTAVGQWINRMLPALSPTASEALAFVVILLFVTFLTLFVLRHTYKETELPGIRQIDQLGGLVIGFVISTIWIGLAIVVLAFVLQTTSGETSAIRDNLAFYFSTSNVIPIFYKVLPIALATLRPWMPKGRVPDIFSFRLY
jgi:membrane protein required for colicin V production